MNHQSQHNYLQPMILNNHFLQQIKTGSIDWQASAVMLFDCLGQSQ